MRLTNYCECEPTRVYPRAAVPIISFFFVSRRCYTGRLARNANSRQFEINGQNAVERREEAEGPLIYISDYSLFVLTIHAFSIISIGNIIFHVLDNFVPAVRKPAHYVHPCYCYQPMLNNNEHVRRVSVCTTLFNGLLVGGRMGGRRSYFTRFLLIR